jgi:uncharacterized membrane protein YqgA involved in biofilm formation
VPLPVGTLINVVTVLAGTILGTVLGARLPERIRETVMHSLGLVTFLVGADAGLQAFRPPLTEAAPRASVLLVMGSILLGGILGELFGIDRGLNHLGEALRRRFGRGQSRFTEGFVVASLVFCVGPLTILGSIQDGSEATTAFWPSRRSSTGSPLWRSPRPSGGGSGSLR